jgi:autotransporter-associated beta strand protein
MNAIYGLCWSTARGCFIVVSEVAKCKGKKSNRRSLSVLTNCFLLASGLMASSAHAADFVNGDFSQPLTTGWSQGGGIFTTPLASPYIMDPSSYTSGTSTNLLITSSSANDPLVPVSMTYNGRNSVRVNDSTNNQSISTISQTVVGYSGSTVNLAWSAVLQSASHPAADTDGFTLKVFDNTTNTVVKLVSYNAVSAASLFTTSGSYLYSGWRAESIAVTAGDTITVSMLATDCDAGGHFGYVYLSSFGAAPVGGSAPLVTGSAPSIPDIVSGNNRTSGNTAGFNLLSNVAGGSNFNNRFDGGALRVDSTASTATNFTITANNGYIDQYGNAAIFSGRFTNDAVGVGGRLVIQNSLTGGSVTLSGTNTHSGGTEIDAGANLTIASSSALGSGTLALVGNVARTITATLSTTADMTISNPITVAYDPTFNVAPNTTMTISSVIADGGGIAGDVVVEGGGTLALTNVNTYTGATTVASGSTLALSGSGSITPSSALNNSGTVDIRGASGNVALGGTLTQASAGSLLMNISPTNNQKVLVTGAASLAGNLSLYASSGTYVAGKYTLITANGVTGTFGTFSSTLPTFTRLAYSLGYDANNVYLFLTPNVADTQTSLTNNLAALQGVYNLQTSTINNGLNYDCSLFDVHGLCISTGGRYTNTNTPTGDSTGALVIGGYRVNDNVRVGAYLDQGISSSTPTGVNLKQHNPLFGAFAVWQARQDGLGAQVKLAAGYNDSDMTVTRAVVGASEAGSGSTSLTSQAVSVVGSYGVEMQGSWIASPYAGIRYTDVKAGGYTEATSSAVTAPLTYSSLSQSTTSLLAGIRWFGKLTDRVGLNGSIGVEQDVSNSNSNYTATGVAGLTSVVFNSDINKTRPVASVGTTVSIDKRQQLAFNVMYREEAFRNSSTTSAYGTYTIGF